MMQNRICQPLHLVNIDTDYVSAYNFVSTARRGIEGEGITSSLHHVCLHGSHTVGVLTMPGLKYWFPPLSPAWAVNGIWCSGNLSSLLPFSPHPHLVLVFGDTVTTRKLLYLMIQDPLCIFASPTHVRKRGARPKELFLVSSPAIPIFNILRWVVRAGDFPFFCANKTRINSTG